MAKTNSKKSLVIVESPAKAKTINKYLGPGFQVKASMGHVRDLPSKGLNVDIDNDFAPTYGISRGKQKTVNSLKSAAKDCDELYLATDLDREGEAIAWHLAEILKFPEEKSYRVIFNAITKPAIKNAFAEPGKLDTAKVMAQQARRILDRIVGYKISPLLWKKVAGGLSAGRVQSVAVKLIVERELKIRKFKPKEYWLIPAVFTTDLAGDYSSEWKDFITTQNEDGNTPTIAEQNDWLTERKAFKAELKLVGGAKFKASDEQQARKIYEGINKAEFEVLNIEKKESRSRPSPPFITSTLQQAASYRIGFSAKRTMRTAQQLYEGIEVGSMGSLGLITYMRTDSNHLSPEAIREARHYISSNIGEDYLPAKGQVYTSKKGAQQAHEAIRPTDVDLTPSEIKSFLTEAQFKLYDLIWRRFTASQMKPARWDLTNVELSGQIDEGQCIYRTKGRTLVFDGFTKIWPISTNDQQLPSLQKGQQVRAVDINCEQHFTKPPARYTEGSLVKTLEKEGIGRPSTYAPIISTIQDRGYVEKIKRKFYATDLGEVVTDKLNGYFPRIMDVSFTRHMEEQLDKIEEQHLNWVGVLREFYGPFKKNLDTATEEMKHAKAETFPSEYTCPKCGAELVYRFGKKGKFLSCSAYPKCKFACPCDKEGKMVEEKPSGHKCPKCGGDMLHKQGRFGKFLGCGNYPKCKTILNLDKDGNVLPPKPPPEPTGIKCYKCKSGELVIRESKRGQFLGCNKFPKCRTIVDIKKLEQLKELQKNGKWPPSSREEAEKIVGKKKKKKKKKKSKKRKTKKKGKGKKKADE